MQDQKTFDRIEKKCLITKEQKKKILPVVKKYMEEDGYYKSEVFNIYFDTDNYDLIDDKFLENYLKLTEYNKAVIACLTNELIKLQESNDEKQA